MFANCKRGAGAIKKRLPSGPTFPNPILIFPSLSTWTTHDELTAWLLLMFVSTHGHVCTHKHTRRDVPANVSNTDMDECKENPCGPGAQCTNLPGGYECSCPSGFRGDPSPLAGCVDVDECTLPQDGKPLCGADASCVNTPGGYFCRCPSGFTGNPRVSCVGESLSFLSCLSSSTSQRVIVSPGVRCVR